MSHYNPVKGNYKKKYPKFNNSHKILTYKYDTKLNYHVMNNVYRIFEYKFHVMETIQNDTIKIYFYYAESFLVHKDAVETR
jgi:hypothetical protein